MIKGVGIEMLINVIFNLIVNSCYLTLKMFPVQMHVLEECQCF